MFMDFFLTCFLSQRPQFFFAPLLESPATSASPPAVTERRYWPQRTFALASEAPSEVAPSLDQCTWPNHPSDFVLSRIQHYLTGDHKSTTDVSIILP